MSTEVEQQFGRILANIAESLDIPESKYEEAVSRYEAVGKWLDANDSKLHIYKPTIYPQGSFRLGTMVKPINDGDEYDIDLVCHLEIDKKNVTQQTLKEMVGNRLKEHTVYKKILEDEGRRCWTLAYANEFHMDILPAIPDYETLNDAILITDKKMREWQPSNPKRYARWFQERMKVIFQQQKYSFAESIKANVEQVPDYKIKTPLQRTIQILKRHRDIYFKGQDCKPISIIITTLAALNYGNEADLFAAITSIINGMADVSKFRHSSGQYYILNPTNTKENFANKWNENPTLPIAYFKWLQRLKVDFDTVSKMEDLHEITETLSPVFGSGVIEKALEKFNDIAISKRNNLFVSPSHREFVPRTKPWREC